MKLIIENLLSRTQGLSFIVDCHSCIFSVKGRVRVPIEASQFKLKCGANFNEYIPDNLVKAESCGLYKHKTNKL